MKKSLFAKAVRTATLVVLSLSLTFSCTSCVTIHAAEMSAGYQATDHVNATVSPDFAPAYADLAFRLFQGTRQEDDSTENALFSPLSAVLCLSLMTNGASGETRAQMEAALGMDIGAMNESLSAYVSSLSTGKDCKFSLANSIWYDSDKDNLHVKESFLQTNADWYGAQAYASPFDSSTVNDMNNWVKKNTDGMIDSIYDELPEDAMMVLINALVFDAKWENKYEKKDITDRVFTNADGSKVTLPMLSSEEQVYFSGNGFTGFAKNYVGGAYSIVGLLPDENTDRKTAAASLTGEVWQSLWENRKTESVNVWMPEFSYAVKMDLKPTMQSLGMTDLFTGHADFSGMAIEPLYCSGVWQKTYISVDRNGTKAAAVTWGEMKNESAPLVPHFVHLDRPFFYLIVDNATGLPLFIGEVQQLGNR